MKAIIGMVRHDELLNQLIGLAMTGGCDYRTLAILAQINNIGPHFLLSTQQLVIVENRKLESK